MLQLCRACPDRIDISAAIYEFWLLAFYKTEDCKLDFILSLLNFHYSHY